MFVTRKRINNRSESDDTDNKEQERFYGLQAYNLATFQLFWVTKQHLTGSTTSLNVDLGGRVIIGLVADSDSDVELMLMLSPVRPWKPGYDTRVEHL
ncbi:hypothetical protein E1B28_000205 [Marasmius oreades]|uniref:Uncharacterized protein n=1 Tax=Marasmius oreades TaxID=181124 RepID=A0A9P7V0S6_9AGAR|nr:uncharacterized protein E1B28_000205 [Marasmius oreades]KAG7098241.1 hypothetical protein E1B28_000205 [Marasmius oreades]